MAEPRPQVVDPRHPVVAWVRSVCMDYREAAELAEIIDTSYRMGALVRQMKALDER